RRIHRATFREPASTRRVVRPALRGTIHPCAWVTDVSFPRFRNRAGRAMATGWAGDGAVQEQIDATVEDAIKRARSQLREGPGLRHCEECDAEIPAARRKAV